MPWAQSTFPARPRGRQRVRTIEGATLTRVERGPLAVVHRPDQWITGAVYSPSGWLLPMSQKTGGLGGHRLAMADPKRIRPQWRARRLRGRWLYGGHWMMHFGHFLTETVTTLWPEGVAPVRGLVFHRYQSPDPRVLPWQQRMVELAGYGDLPIEFVDQRQTRVGELVLPSRSFIQHGWGRRGAVAVWRRMRAAVPQQPPPWGAKEWPTRVYLSRTAHHERMRARGRNQPRASAARDAMLDELFGEAGFEVVAPEELAIDDQIRLAAGARVLAGQAGSALHLAGFAREGARVLELGDSRSARAGVRSQQVINALAGHLSAFEPPASGREELRDRLQELGVWQSEPGHPGTHRP